MKSGIFQGNEEPDREPRQEWDEKEELCITGKCLIKGLA